MAKQIQLSVRPRAEAGRNAVKRVHQRGAVPAVLYGATQSAKNLEIDRKEIETVMARAAGEHVLVELQIQEGSDRPVSRLALVQEVQHHPVRRTIMHVDFHAVSTSEPIEAAVPIEPDGEPEGVKTYGGTLQQALRTLDIRCLPQNLPDTIRVDVSRLMVGESIHVKDIQLPAGVEAVTDPDLTVISVAEPTVAEEPVEAPAAAQPEVLKEKKAETAGEK